jgi:membrane protein insertase Oxa1/YidC/SpoIIIJ
MDLSLSPSQALQISIITAIPFLLLMGGMLVSQIFQNRQIQGRSQNQSTPPQQQAIMKILPFMLPVISFSFPAGLGLYYFVQGLCRLGTQAYITKKFYGEGSAAAVVIDTDGSEKPDDAIEAAAVDADDGSPASGTTASGKAASGKAKTKGGTEKQASSNGQGSSGNGKKPGNSTKSQAVQKKKDQGSTPSSGRKSGSPRTGGGRRSGQS